jgi:phospholipid-binding lipoprotein MlaA
VESGVISMGRKFKAKRPITGALAAAMLGFAPVATLAAESDNRINDPFEGLNRKMLSVHFAIDRALIRPAMVVYTHVLPGPIRSGLTNVVGNLGEPVTFVNDVLQVRPRAAGRTLTRFATNSTIGVGGLFNLADSAGFPRHYSDFGQTLGRYGLGPGPFLIIPGLGPSSVRDMAGRVADQTLDPVNHIQFDGDMAVRLGRTAVVALDARAFYDTELRELERTAIDPYVTMRSAYLQNRQSLIRGPQESLEYLPSFTSDAPAPTTDTPPAF